MELNSDQIKALKGRGFLLNKDGVHFSCRVVVPAGKLTAAEAGKITAVSEKYGRGYFTLTQRLDVEIPWLAYEDLDQVADELAEAGLAVGGTGMRLRPICTCKGNVCQFAFFDTEEVAKKFHERFYNGMYGLGLPNKLRINIGGCPINCSQAFMACVGVYGKKAGQVAITLGGKLGRSPQLIGREIRGLYSIDEAMDLVEKTIHYYKENGQPGERFASMVERIGFATVEDALLK